MKVAAVILSGGASRRMGTPKALLEFAGETFLNRLIGIFEQHCAQVIVVLGYDAERVRAGAKSTAEFVVNPTPDQGQVSSLQCGFQALAHDIDATFFTPVDYPGVRPETVAAMRELADGAAAIVPQYQKQHGHPVLVSRNLIQEFLALGPEATGRDVMHRHVESTRYVDVDDPGILLDVDDPQAYRTLTQELL